MRAAWTSLWLVTACGDLVPDTAADVATEVVGHADVAAEVTIPEGVSCESDADCAAYAACCVDPRCRDGVCLPFYVPACCTSEGPCASTSPFHAGTCEETCVANGCEETWSPPPGSCAEVLHALTFDAEGLAEATLQDADPSDRVTWVPSAERPFAGRPSLRAGDLVCATYYDGPLGGDCRPVDPTADAGPVRLALLGPKVTLPLDRPAVAELWVWIDVGPGHVDGLVVEVQPDGLGAVTVWDSRLARPPTGTWVPLLVDLAPYAGRPTRVALVFDTLDGRDNDHPGVHLGALAIRTLCADDRTCPEASACALGREVPILPLSDRACVVAPPDPGPACVPCLTEATCPVADSCDVATCEAGVCRVSHELDAACCTPDVTWPGDGSFEGPLEPGWEAEPGWTASQIRSLVGEGALHFGLPDGSGLGAPGERARGVIWSPAFDMPRDAPVLSFGLYLSTEWDASPSTSNPAGVDRLEVVVRPDVGPTAPHDQAAATVWRATAIGGTTGGRWARIRVSLDDWAGRRVRLGFVFDSGDEHDNDGEGVFIDDARVFRACPGCGPERVAPDCDPG